MTDSLPPRVADLNDQYRDTLAAQARLRREGYEALEAADAFPPLDVDAIAAAVRAHASEFAGDLVFLAASDFGHPCGFVPAAAERDASALLNDLLDELHRERGKWLGEDEALRAVRRDVLDDVPGIHKALPAHVTADGVSYDLGAGLGDEYNFVTIRQVVGLVDWLANSYQADGLVHAY